MKYLLLWSCGPVQDFIASARKGRDLWFGSWLLSEVSTAAALHLMRANAKLLLPAPQDEDELQRPDFDVPNKVLAEVTVDGEEAVTVLGEAISEAARGRLLALARWTFDKLPEETFDRGPALDQVAELLETYWVAVPFTADFRASRFRAEALLAARKTRRAFAPPSFAAAGVPKSSLDGQREAVTHRGAGLRLGLNRDERLCGVGVLKRMGHTVAPSEAPGGRVASVSSFALATWLRPALAQSSAEALRHPVRELKHALQQAGLEVDGGGHADSVLGGIDAHAFYASRLQDLTEDLDATVEAAHRAAMGVFRQRVLEACGVRLPAAPTPYYAMLLADGDRMGAFLDRMEGPEQVRAVSEALTQFADRVRTQVLPGEPLGGQCVYAGGDDVLALVPVDQALDVAQKLRQAFEELMAGVEAPTDVARPTLSVGICVAHHLQPLADVLTGVRAAERLAKDAGRNAWAVRVAKRGGAPIDAVGQWFDGSAERLAAYQGMFGQGLPHGLPYELREAAVRLRRGAAEDTPRERFRALDESELRRILRQKQKDQNQTIESMRDDLVRGLDDLADRLLVARALAGVGGGA